MKLLSDCLLYAFVDTVYLHGRGPAEVARSLCEGGADIIQLRAKDLAAERVREMAVEILRVTRPAGVALVINDHLQVAIQTGAEYCHLGQEDFFDAGHRHTSELRPSGGNLGIGLSTHAPAQALRAVEAGADYLGIGPLFATGTKPTARPVTLEYARWAAANVRIPWFAIGGINLENLDQVLAAGVKRICVVSAILNPQDIRAATRAFKERLVAAQK